MNSEKTMLLIQYLEILQNGRVKPDYKGGTIRDSLDNIPEIIATKELINKEFQINLNNSKQFSK